jgi:pilus assembly protein Flp/PilA
MKAMIQKLFREEDGATAVEYGLLVSLIAVAIATTVGLLGTSLDTLFGTVKTKIENTGG